MPSEKNELGGAAFNDIGANLQLQIWGSTSLFFDILRLLFLSKCICRNKLKLSPFVKIVYFFVQIKQTLVK